MAINLRAVLSLTDNFTRPLQRATRTIESVESRTRSADRALGRAGISGQRAFNNVGNAASSASNGMNRAVKAVAGLAGGIIAAKGAAELLDATLGEAMRYEQQEVLVEAMFDDRKASKAYAKMVQKMAEDSPIMDTSTMMGSSKAFVGITKELPALKQAWKVAEKLSIMDPEQGLEGSVLALKELSGGDGQSLAERFELPRKVVNNLKNLSFDDQLAGIQKYLDKLGITDKTVDKMGNATISKWNQVKEKMQSTFRSMGTDGNSQIGTALDGVLKGLDNGAFNKVAKQVDAGLGQAIEKVANYVKTIDFNDLGNKASKAFTAMSNGAKWVTENWGTITKVVKGVAIAFIGLKSLSFLVSTFTTIASTVRIVSKVFTGVTKVIGLARKAFTLIRLSMLLFPGTWIIGAIGAVIAIAIALYKNWDKVKAATLKLWDAIGGGKGAIRIVMGPLGILIGAAVDLAKNWDKTKGVWQNVWDAIKRSAAESVNSVIGGINTMIETINKLPGVNIPVIAKVDWGSSPSTMPAKVLDKKVLKLGNLVNYVPKTVTKATQAVAGAAKPMPNLNLLPGHKNGLPFVNKDNYLARLHYGERVLTREENQAYSEGEKASGVVKTLGGTHYEINITGNTFGGTVEQQAEKLVSLIVTKLETAGGAGA